jgi:hypothetical protein
MKITYIYIINLHNHDRLLLGTCKINSKLLLTHEEKYFKNKLKKDNLYYFLCS